MKILVACEYSARVRDAFRAKGHDAWSCDLLPTDGDPRYHYQCDVRGVLHKQWDMLIAFPTCTFLTISAEWAYSDGPHHQQVKPGTLVGAARRAAREDAIDFFRLLWEAPIPCIAIENPIGCISSRVCKPSQIIQPHQFGEDASKATCLWLKGLPPLVGTRDFPPRVVIHKGRPVSRWSNQTDSGQNRLPPSADRWKRRSDTFQGIAQAFAAQWG